jgi:MOSC domain-containing protein YiiM
MNHGFIRYHTLSRSQLAGHECHLTKSMKVISLNVGRPREVATPRGPVLTAIWKAPIEGRVALRRFNIAGDQQADLRVHGGEQKAVYLYPSEHYAFWRRELPGMEMTPGMFGENLTTEGIDEGEVQIGDRFRVGSAVLQVSQPRMPCFKLQLRFGRPDMVKRFWLSGRSGIYFSIVEEGELAAGDEMVPVSRMEKGISVGELVKLYRDPEPDPARIQVALAAPLAGSWKTELRARLYGEGPSFD